MKKSELASFIKEEIKSTLNTEGVWKKGHPSLIQKFIDELGTLKNDYYNIVGSDDVFNGLDQAERAAKELMSMAEATIETSPEDLAKVKKSADKDDVIKVTKEEVGIEETKTKVDDLQNIGYDDGEYAVSMHFNKDVIDINSPLDYKYYRRGFLQGVKDSTASYKLEENEDKEPSKSDLKKTKGLAKAKEELAQLTKQMKSLARKYKESEGEEKEKLVADLKKKTKLKKELEAIIDK